MNFGPTITVIVIKTDNNKGIRNRDICNWYIHNLVYYILLSKINIKLKPTQSGIIDCVLYIAVHIFDIHRW